MKKRVVCLTFYSLAERRLSIRRTLFKFKQIACGSHILRYLLSAKRGIELTCRRRLYVRGNLLGLKELICIIRTPSFPMPLVGLIDRMHVSVTC